MKDSTILKTSIIISLLGITVLVFLANSIDEPQIMINNIDETNFENIKISGEIK